MKWITLALTMTMLAACIPAKNCQVVITPGTGPQGCYSAEDLRSLCRAAMECGGGTVWNGIGTSLRSCPGAPDAGQVFGELMSSPGPACRKLLR